jgi:2'-5' RNA ligase
LSLDVANLLARDPHQRNRRCVSGRSANEIVVMIEQQPDLQRQLIKAGRRQAPNRFMAHIAIQQNGESGSPVTWGEHVTNAQYTGGRAA